MKFMDCALQAFKSMDKDGLRWKDGGPGSGPRPQGGGKTHVNALNELEEKYRAAKTPAEKQKIKIEVANLQRKVGGIMPGWARGDK